MRWGWARGRESTARKNRGKKKKNKKDLWFYGGSGKDTEELVTPQT